MGDSVSIVLVGVGGYGALYLEALMREPADRRARLVGVVDPHMPQSALVGELRARGVPEYPDLAAFFARERADLAVISSPIHRHCEQTCGALEHGAHVLCEKPAAATVQDVDRMIRAREKAGRLVAVGYQWSFCTAIQSLKRDIAAGMYGAARRLKTLCLWPRDESYYRRNQWAGRQRDDAGAWVLDSPLNNAMAHDLHNLLYLLGPGVERSAQPVEVVAELYQANAIENFDTAAVRIHADAGANAEVEILFYGSHAVGEDFGPVFSLEFDGGSVEYAGGGTPIVGRRAGAAEKVYGSPHDEPQVRKLWTCVAAAAEGGEVPCGLEAARSQTVCMNGAQDSVERVVDIPMGLVRVEPRAAGRLTWVPGLAETWQRCYGAGALPSEMGVPWARAGRRVELAQYQYFPSAGAGG